MKKLYLLFVVLLFTSYIQAQLQNILWQRTIGGSGSELIEKIIETSEGGFIAIGWANSEISGLITEPTNGGNDYWVVKLDSEGFIEWQNVLGGSGGDYPADIIQTSDGNYVVLGRSASGVSGDKTEPRIGIYDYWILKLDSSGSIIWQKTIGGDSIEQAYSVIETSDLGFLISGYSDSSASGDKSENSIGLRDYWVVKLSENGQIEWENTIGGTDQDHLHDAVQTSDGGYLLVGDSESNISGDKTEDSIGGKDYWLVKISSGGTIEWQNTIGGSSTDVAWSTIIAEDNNYIIAGNSSSNISGDKTENSNGIFDYWIMKIDNNGNIIWQNTIGGSDLDLMAQVTLDITGGYTAAGYSTSNISGDKTENSNGVSDYWVVHLDQDGNLDNQKTLGGSDSDVAVIAQQISTGEYLIAGYSSSNISGDKSENSYGHSDFWILKMDGVLGTNDQNQSAISITPNPVADMLRINDPLEVISSYIIYDSVGKVILQASKLSETETVSVHSLSPGLYYIHFTTDNGTVGRRFVKR